MSCTSRAGGVEPATGVQVQAPLEKRVLRMGWSQDLLSLIHFLKPLSNPYTGTHRKGDVAGSQPVWYAGLVKQESKQLTRNRRATLRFIRREANLATPESPKSRDLGVYKAPRERVESPCRDLIIAGGMSRS